VGKGREKEEEGEGKREGIRKREDPHV